MTADHIEPISDEDLETNTRNCQNFYGQCNHCRVPWPCLRVRMTTRIRAEEKAAGMWRAAESKANAEIERLRSQPNEGPIVAAQRAWLDTDPALGRLEVHEWLDQHAEQARAEPSLDRAKHFGLSSDYWGGDGGIGDILAEQSRAERVAEARRVLEFHLLYGAEHMDEVYFDLDREAEAYVKSLGEE